MSLPADLLALIERRRRDRQTNRSETVSELLWRGWHQVEAEDREERYRSAYQAQPETHAERTWAEEAASDLLEEHGNTARSETDLAPGAAS